MKSRDIHIRAISQEMPQPSITKICLKITYLKFHSNFSGVHELTFRNGPQILHGTESWASERRGSPYHFYLTDIRDALFLSSEGSLPLQADCKCDDPESLGTWCGVIITNQIRGKHIVPTHYIIPCQGSLCGNFTCKVKNEVYNIAHRRNFFINSGTNWSKM